MFRNALLVISMSFGLTGALAGDALAAPKAPAQAAPAQAAPAKGKAKAAPSKLYTARVTSEAPLAVGIAIDQSGSNRHNVAGGDVATPKANALANAVNANIESMLVASVHGVDEETNEPTFKPWFKVAGVGYSTGTRPLFGNKVAFVSTTELSKSGTWLDANGQPSRDPNGKDYVQMKWVDPVAQGYTHMGEGLGELVPVFEQFVKEHPHAPAPVAMHFTDGRPEGGAMQHMEMAKKLKGLKTKDGNVILFNVHVGETGGAFMFPTREMIDKLPTDLHADALRLFEMSSPLPPAMLAKARSMFPEYQIQEGARAMVYNASGALIGQLLEMGTVQNMKSRK